MEVIHLYSKFDSVQSILIDAMRNKKTVVLKYRNKIFKFKINDFESTLGYDYMETLAITVPVRQYLKDSFSINNIEYLFLRS